jgi:hypothetical protein
MGGLSNAALLSALFLAEGGAAVAQTASPSPAPAVTLGADFTLTGFNEGRKATDSEIGDALINITAGAGNVRASATVGAYGFPTLGFPIVPVNQPGANAELYSALPVAALQYTFNSHLSVAAGKFAALLGQESPFTYQNLNIQRGIGWAMEPTISRGVQVVYSNGPWSATLQENDAYYSGTSRAVEGLLGWAPSSSTSLQFAFIVPGKDAGPNPTTSIGNKAEYDLMYARQTGKLQLLPYLLYVRSPESAKLGYTSAQNATAAVLLADWAFSPQFSLPFRYEYARNGSSSSDTSPNADLVGFGPGSTARTFTLTPAYRFGNGGLLRIEYSNVAATGMMQSRIGFEFGVFK